MLVQDAIDLLAHGVQLPPARAGGHHEEIEQRRQLANVQNNDVLSTVVFRDLSRQLGPSQPGVHRRRSRRILNGKTFHLHLVVGTSAGPKNQGPKRIILLQTRPLAEGVSIWRVATGGACGW